MGKYYEWGNCSLCPSKRPTRPIKRIEFPIIDRKKELVCDFCLSIIKDEAKKRGEEICQTCYDKSLNSRTVVLEDFYKSLNGDCPRCATKTKDLEEQLRQNQEDTARTRQEIEENNRRSDSSANPNRCAVCHKDFGDETSYYFPSDKLTQYCADCYPKQNKPATSNPTPSSPSSNSNQSNNSPFPQQTPNQEENSKCYDCQKEFQQGEKTHYIPYDPDKKWCDLCDLAKKRVYLQASQQILARQTVTIDQLNTTFDKKQVLKALVRIKNGEKVNIDGLVGISDEDKADLKEIQQKSNSSNVSDSKPFYTKGSFWNALIIVICLIATVYQIYRWRKAKKAGKNYNWWTNKISD